MLAPHQLKHCTFVKLAPQSKNPNINGHGWNTNPAAWLTFDQLNAYLDASAGNYGIFTGDALTVIIDLDGPQDLSVQLMNRLPITFAVESGTGGRYHLTYSVNDKLAFRKYSENVIPLTHNNQHIGEIRFGAVQTVGPGSIHPNGNIYTVYREIDVAQITSAQILETLAPYINHQKIEKTRSVTNTHGANPNSILPVIKTIPNLKNFGDTLIGPHPAHGSTSGENFHVWTSRNIWHCFRHSTGGNVFHLIAVLNGLLPCENCRPGSLSGPLFQKCVNLYREKYGGTFQPFAPQPVEHFGDFSHVFTETPWPSDLFPPFFNNIVNSYSESFSAPPEIPGLILLTVLSSLIGRKIEILIKHDFTQHPPLWFIAVGSSGTGKTPITQHLLKPLIRIQKECEEDYQIKLDAYLATKDSKHKHDQPHISKPPHRKPLTSDVTCEKLAELMRDNPAGILQYRDEISGLIRGMDAYRKQGSGKDIAFYLSTFNNEPVTVDRMNGSFFVPYSALAILGGLQTERLNHIFNDATFEMGFIQRFIFAYFPDRLYEFNTKSVSPETHELIHDLYSSAFKMDFNDSFPVTFRASAEALDLFAKEANRLRLLSKYVPFKYRSFLSKSEYYIAKFCALFHFLQKPTPHAFVNNVVKGPGIQPGFTPDMISPEIMRKSISLNAFLLGKTAILMDKYAVKEPPPTTTEDTITDILQTLKEKIGLPALLTLVNDKLPVEVRFKSEKSLGKKLRIMKIQTEREWDTTQNKNIRYCQPLKETTDDF